MIRIFVRSSAAIAFLAAGILSVAPFPVAGADWTSGELAGHRDECPCRPYWIEEIYDPYSDRHIARMRYAPGYHPSDDRYHYWYNRRYAYNYVSRPRASHSKHVEWCRARYKTYSEKTDTFVGKGMIKYRCNSPYDGLR